MNSSIGIAGPGRVGQTLGRLLHGLGEPVAAVAGRDSARTSAAAKFIGRGVQSVHYSQLAGLCSRIIVSVPDDAIEPVARILAATGAKGAALHTCGARGPEALAPLLDLGVSCAAMHPLQTVTTPQQGLNALPGAAFAVTGEGPAADWARHIVTALGGEILEISAAQRPLYHAAAVMASNNVVVLVDAAVMLMGEAGIEEPLALRALAPLLHASLENVLALGPARALTGPVERGDGETIATHLRALSAASGSLPGTVEGLYRAAALHAIDLANRTPAQTRSRRSRQEMEQMLRETSSKMSPDA